MSANRVKVAVPLKVVLALLIGIVLVGLIASPFMHRNSGMSLNVQNLTKHSISVSTNLPNYNPLLESIGSGEVRLVMHGELTQLRSVLVILNKGCTRCEGRKYHLPDFKRGASDDEWILEIKD